MNKGTNKEGMSSWRSRELTQIISEEQHWGEGGKPYSVVAGVQVTEERKQR